jgi:hypothetical protein
MVHQLLMAGGVDSSTHSDGLDHRPKLTGLYRVERIGLPIRQIAADDRLDGDAKYLRTEHLSGPCTR